MYRLQYLLYIDYEIRKTIMNILIVDIKAETSIYVMIVKIWSLVS